MAKITGPLFSLDARGSVGRSIVYSIWKGVNYLRRHVVPQNPQTDAQVAIRQVITDGSQKWKDGTITSGDKADWNTFAEGKPFSGFNAFMKAYVAVNFDPMTQTVESPQVIPDAPTP